MTKQRNVGRLAVLLLTTIVALFPMTSTTASGERVALPGHVLPALADSNVSTPVAKADLADEGPLTLTLVLRRDDQTGFDEYLADVYNPASPRFRRFASTVELSDRFGPSPGLYAAVEAHFRAEGFDVLERSANRLTLTLRATRSQAERAFLLKIDDYQTGGRRFFANDRAPQLPAALARHVQAVLGLSDLAGARRLSAEPLHASNWCLNDPNSKAIFGTFCQNAYNNAFGILWAGAIWNFICPWFGNWGGHCVALPPPTPPPDRTLALPSRPAADDGLGQKIGIAHFDSFRISDVADWLALAGAPAAQINRVSLVPMNGGAALGPNQTEALLDINAVMAIVPGAQVVVYSLPFAGAGSFQTVFNRMIADGVTVITNSWAYCENETTAADVQSIDAILQAAAAAGISVLSASGDTGSTCLNGSPNTIVVPAGAPYATAVGGTSVDFAPGGFYVSETWWDGSAATPRTGQGGFGVSRFFPRPAYQNALSQAATRSIPDLAVTADPAKFGVMLCVADDGGCPNGLLYGGTSFSAPFMAGMIALLNDRLGHRVGWLNPQLYALASTGAFHSPASMGSDFAHVGIGSPNFSVLGRTLKGHALGTPTPAMSRVHAAEAAVAADGSTTTMVSVQLRDANGYSVAGKTVSLSGSPGSAAVITPPSGVTNLANGAVLFAVKNATVQDVTFTATDVTDGVVIAEQATVRFVVPAATAGGIQAFPLTVLNDGIAATTITVTLQDALGNPTPGKVVALSQGSGRSIITAPSPAVTDAAGQIQFTATNRIAETIVYTAVDVTDGNLPIPGSATVSFTGTASSSCVGAAPGAAPGYALTPFATGFLAEAFNYSNVNWSCAGASNPAFDPSGAPIIANFRTGALYKLPAGGGAASSGNVISTPGLTLGQPVYGKDGKLYATRGATGGGFSTGNILHLDPQTGATIRVVASNLTCPGGLSVDPISGDLFFTGTCFGAGSNDPQLYRVTRPGSTDPMNPPAVSIYATLPSSPNGALAFAPDGTIFTASNYLAPAPQMYRVSGTNQPQPPSITVVPGVTSTFWVTMGETLPDGSAKSLIVLADNKLQLANITVAPPTFTDLTDGPISSGVVGPDGCLYASNVEIVYKLANANGSCGFTPTNPTPAISLTPAVVVPNPVQGTTLALTARVVGTTVPAGTAVVFTVSGANAQLRLGRTDVNGVATFVMHGMYPGGDSVTAEAAVGPSTLRSNRAAISWSAGKHTALVTLDGGSLTATMGVPVTLSGALVDGSVGAAVPIPGVQLAFSVAGQTCNANTNAAGIASCGVTIPLAGSYTLTVSYAGNATYLAATDSRAFLVVVAPPPPCFAFNDVDSTSPFCANVDWIKNRGVTLGCAVGLYCPVDSVFRLQMAAFMNRLGTALSPTVLFNALEPGAIDLDAQPVVCQTGDFATDAFTRRALVDASFSARGAANVGYAADAVASFDAGATWVPLAAVGNRAFASASQWGHVRAHGIADLDPGQTVRFGLWVSRGGLAGTADLTDSRCKVRAAIGSR